MKETVYIYNVKDTDKLRKIQFAMMQLKVKLNVIQTDMLNQKVGYIAELEGFEHEHGAADNLSDITDEVMLMKDFTSSRVDMLLSALKKSGVRIKLKAVLTDTNKNWYFHDLCKELLREHTELNK